MEERTKSTKEKKHPKVSYRFLEVWCSERCSSKPRMPRAKRVAILKLEPRRGLQQGVAIPPSSTCDVDILRQNATRHVNNTKGCQKELHLARVSAEKPCTLRPVLPVLKSHVTDWWKPLAGPAGRLFVTRFSEAFSPRKCPKKAQNRIHQLAGSRGGPGAEL